METIKLPLFTDDMVMEEETLIEPTEKLPELISEFSKLSGFKTNLQKSTVFLYPTNNRKLKIF